LRWHGENGDEFILLLPGARFDEAQKVICRIKQSFSFFSWGIIELTSADDLESAVQRAEELMYRHKRIKAGHNI